MRIIVTIPAFNEARTIGHVVRGSLEALAGRGLAEVLVIDDASTDRTAHLAEQAGATVVRLRHRRGLGHVFGVALEQARQRRADVMVNIDGDGQFNPADIPRLIAPLLDDAADFVTCTRFEGPLPPPRMPRVKYWGNRAVVALVNHFCGCGARFTDVSCGFRAFNREAICRLTLFGKFTYTQEVFMDLFRKNLRIAEVPLPVRGQRRFGKSRVASNVLHYGVHSGMIMLRAVRDIQPLKFFGTLAALLFAVSSCLAAFLVAWYMSSGRTSPFTSLITVNGVTLILSFVLLTVGMLADMVSRHRQITEELLYLTRQNRYAAVQPAQAVAKRVNGGAIDESPRHEMPQHLTPVIPTHLAVPRPRTEAADLQRVS